MYQAHWGLSESPFPGGLNVRSFYRSPTHDEALARLHFLTEERRRLGLLLGGPGSGKSLLLRVFASEVRRQGSVAFEINLLGVGPQEFLLLVAQGLGLVPGRGASVACLWRAITDRLAENRFQRLSTIMLLDDVDEAAPEVLEQVARLAQAEMSADAHWTVVLAAATHRWQRLGSRLLTLAELKIDLLPWDAADTAQFLAEAMSRAGRKSPTFEEAAALRLHELAHGVPRRLNQLANLSLVATAGQELPLVDEATVDLVSSELGIEPLLAGNLASGW